MATRKQVRQALVTLFDANSTFNLVLGYLPLDLRGATKVLCLYSESTTHDFISGHLNNNFYTFYLDTLVKRTDSDADENDLDDMHEAIRSVVRANIPNANWDELELSDSSDPLFAELSGVPYRVEQHRLKVKVQTNS